MASVETSHKNGAWTKDRRIIQAVNKINADLERNGFGGTISKQTIRRVHVSGTHKICVKCGRVRRLEKFSPNIARRNGIASWCKPCRARQQLLRTYGITYEEYDRLREQQRRRCAICESPIAKRGRQRGYVDHNHQTGRVRGLLCSSCNFAIGHLRDNSALARRAAEYLESHT